MNMTPFLPGVAPMGEVDDGPLPFEVLRALIAARQSATPTARLMADRRGNSVSADGVDQLIAMFAHGPGRVGVSGGFASAQPCPPQDQQNA